MFIDRNEEKNELLKGMPGRDGIGFEHVEQALEDGKLLDWTLHKNQAKYPGQKMLVIEIKGYAWKVPCVENEKGLFLKTMYPSRQATKLYLSNYS